MISAALQRDLDSMKDAAGRLLGVPRAPAPRVIVTPTVITPDGKRVPCGAAYFPRAVADVFDRVLTVTSADTGAIIEEYPPTYWYQAVQYSALGTLDSVFMGDMPNDPD